MAQFSFTKKLARRLEIATLLLLVPLAPSLAWEKPLELKPSGYVNDFAGVIGQSTKFQLTALCTEVNDKTHAQISVVTVKSLEGLPVEDFSIKLATKWGIGPKQTERGVLILLATEDRKYRFEVGYGLEPILPDGRTGSIGREAVPYLREGNFDAAILFMTRRVAEIIAQDRGVVLTVRTPAVPPPRSLHGGNDSGLVRIVAWLIIGFLLLIFRFARQQSVRGGDARYGRGRGGWWVGPMLGAGLGGGWGGGRGGGFGGGGGGGGGFGGFGGGSFGGGGASGSW
jgi:uncharacterized protein